MTTETAFVSAFMTFTRGTYITVMGTVFSIQAVVKRFIRSSLFLEYDMGFHFFGYSSTVLKNPSANGFKTHVFIKRMLDYISFV